MRTQGGDPLLPADEKPHSSPNLRGYDAPKAVAGPAFLICYSSSLYMAQHTTSRTTLDFTLRFLVFFAALYCAFEASRGSAFERVLIEDLILRPTTALINVMTPADQVTLLGRTLASPGANLHVVRGCEGIELFLILVAGIMAFPADWTRRARGLMYGCCIAYVLSVGRLIALHYILRNSPSAWEAMHGLILPLVPLLLMAFYFLRWCGRGAPSRHALS